ncbi:hypothetical protein [Mariprofundus ferrooxydans]|uniref:phage major capsid protein n=1 Tax=Mariprofundus ferrooxydans TaxID=314344 RepID=UPI00142F6754|nr:hypothetical protein [Mariprofundus ferrooxydans]
MSMKTKIPASGIDFAAWKNDGAFDGNAEARADLIADVNDYFGDVFNPQNAVDTTLEGQKSREMGGFDVGGGSPLDFAYMALFKEVNLRTSTSRFHEVVDISAGITFTELVDGEKAKVGNISAASNTIKALEYGAALGILDRWIRYNEFFRVEEALQAAVKTYGYKQADMHYALLKALGTGVNEAFDTSVEKTIDNACATILEAVGDKYGLSDQTEFTILANRRNASIIRKALAASFDKPNANNGKIESNIGRFVITSNTNIPASAGAYVALPEHSLESATWRDLTSEEARSAARRGTDLHWSGEFNAAIGNSSQVRRIALA